METYQVLRREPLQFVHIDLNLHVNCILLLQYQENTNPVEKMKDVCNITIFTSCESNMSTFCPIFYEIILTDEPKASVSALPAPGVWGVYGDGV